MPSKPALIATIADVHRLSREPYTRYMPHRRVLHALEEVAQSQPERIALTAIDDPLPEGPCRRWSYQELVEDVRRAANLFHRLGAGKPVRVALLMPPMAETHVALWGAETAGVACPINYQLNHEHVAELIRAIDASILVVLGPAPDLDIDQKTDDLVRDCPDLRHVLQVRAGPGMDLRPGQLDFAAEIARHDGSGLRFAEPADDTAALFHTGGTTGAPKLARHTHANQLHAAWGAACMYGTRPSDVMLTGFPLFHVAGSFVFGLSTLLAGGEVVLPTRTGLRNSAFMSNFGQQVERFGVTFLAAVPTVIAGLLALKLNNDHLRTVRALLTGGSPLPDELAAAFEARHGVPVRNILGMTESAGVISIEPLASPRTPGSCGLPLPYSEVVAVDAEGVRQPAGHSGILRIRGPNVSPGYTDAERNAGSFEGGWLVSGDIGHVDSEGRVFVTGRAKDVIIRGAHNIDPGLIESALLRHPGVLMAAAVGEPDAYAGELPVAFVSLKPGEQVTPAELLAFVTPLIAERPAVPKRIHIIATVPVTAVGKIYKPRLRAEATRYAMESQLAQRGLQGRVAVVVDESSGGLSVHFRATEPGVETAISEFMKPFALRYSVEVGPGQ